MPLCTLAQEDNCEYDVLTVYRFAVHEADQVLEVVADIRHSVYHMLQSAINTLQMALVDLQQV